MRKRSRLLTIGGGGVVIAVLAGAAGVYSLHGEAGGRSLAHYVSAAASSPDMTLEIDAIDSIVSSHPSVTGVTISDRDGPWLKIDRVSVTWSPLALIGMTLNIDNLAVGEIDVLRKPAPRSPQEEKPAPRSGGMTFPPKPPIGIRLGQLVVDRLVFAEAVIGSPATLSLEGDAELAAATARVRLLAQRRDAPGSISADAAYAGPPGELRVKLALSEPGDGLIARLANIPGLPPVEASINGDGTLDDFDAKINARAGEAALQGGAKIVSGGAARNLTLDLSASRLAELLPPDLAPLFGDTTTIKARAHDGDNIRTLDRLTLAASALQLDAAGALDAQQSLDGKVTLAAPDLARFSRLAGRDLHGALDLSADLAGKPLEGAIVAKLKGAVDSFGSGVPAFDGLTGEKLTLSGTAASLAGGGIALDQLELSGAHMSVRVDGRATQDTAAIGAKLDVPELRYAGLPLTGRANLVATVDGSLAKPNAVLIATLQDARANGRPIPQATLKCEAHDLLGALAASATLDGVIDRKSARGRALVAREGAGWKVDDLDLAIGGVTSTGALALDGAGLATGRLAINAPDLDDLSAIALQKLGGRLDATITLDAVGGGQNVGVNAQGAGVAASRATIDKLAANFQARDLYRKPLLEGLVSVDNLRAGQEIINKARLAARPQGNGAAALDLSLDARGFYVAGRATLTPGDTTRLDIGQFSAQRGGKKIAFARPAVITLQKGAAEIRGVAVALGTGRLDVDGVVGERLDLTANARAIPLSIASIFNPALGLEGVIDAHARITGSKAAPAGDWRVKLTKASAPQLRANAMPSVDASASGRLADSRTTVESDIALGATSRLKISGSAPLGSGALDLAVKGVLDAALANTMLAINGQTAAGKANVDLRLSGATTNPMIGGTVSLASGAFNDPLNGVSLANINGRLEGRGRELTINGFTAQTKNGGSIAVAGNVTVAPDAGMPGAIHITANNAQLANTDIVSTTGDLDLTISGPLARAPKIAGKVTLDSMDVSVPDRLPVTLKPLANSTHIDARGFATQMLALERKEKAKAARKSNFDASLDLALSAPNKIFVRGRGIDAEFGGALKINGTIQKPNVVGGFDLRRGKLQLLTQRIDITRGKLSFTGGLAPALDFLAETKAADVTAKIGVTGPAAAPVFAFSSSPELPEDEVLSRLLFAKASGSLTAFQAVQLAAALAQFSGSGTGVDAFEKMRKALGVDSLDLDAAGANGPSIGVSRYIMNGVSVGAKTGANPGQTAVNVGVDVTRGLRVQTETTVDGKTSVGVGYEHEY